MTEFHCLNCGKTFAASPSDKPSYCSTTCHDRARMLACQRRVEIEIGEPIERALKHLYNEEQRPMRYICKEFKINARTFLKWCNEFGIARRKGSDAIKTQWLHADARKRKQASWMCRLGKSQTGERSPSKRADVRHKISESKKGARNPMYNHFRELNPNWKGGKMTAYGAAWESAKRQIRRRDHDKCRLCNSTKQLEVHHVKPYRASKDNSLDNLILLCTQCHRKAERGQITLGRV